MPVTCEERWAAHTACARAALPSSAAAAPSAPTSELEEARAAVPRPVLLAEAFALPFGAAALGAGAFLAAGAGAVGWAAGLPKSVSCGMGLDHEGDGDSDGDGGDGDGGDGDGGDGDGGDRRRRSSKHARKSGGHSGSFQLQRGTTTNWITDGQDEHTVGPHCRPGCRT